MDIETAPFLTVQALRDKTTCSSTLWTAAVTKTSNYGPRIFGAHLIDFKGPDRASWPAILARWSARQAVQRPPRLWESRIMRPKPVRAVGGLSIADKCRVADGGELADSQFGQCAPAVSMG